MDQELKYRITFMAHSNSGRVYSLETDDKGAAYFTAAALREANWHRVEVEDVPTQG